jgi:UDP-glucose 4-epimerase
MSGFFSGKRALVTGGAGAIGSCLTRRLIAQGAKVTVIDDFSASGGWNVSPSADATFVAGDVLDRSKLEQAFEDSPNFVFHLAAFFANQNSVEHPERDLEVNSLGTLRVLEMARQSGCKRVVYTSSSSVYDTNAKLPITEDAITIRLTTPYQVSKLAGEMYCWYFYEHFGMEVAVARVFSSYGPGEMPGKYRNVIPNFLYQAMRGEALTITGTGEETRDFTYVDDVVEGLMLCASLPEANGKSFNLASGREIEIGWLAEEINRLTGNRAGIVRRPRRDWDQKLRTLGSIDAATRTLGYSPRTSIDDGLKSTKQWIDANLEHMEVAANSAYRRV